MRHDRTVTDDQQQAQADAVTQDTAPTARLALTDRYTPRVCAHPGCRMPPHTTWTVTASGRIYERWWEAGDTLDLCGTHEHDNGQPIRMLPPPRRRRRP